jgi:hypothetical protein
LSSVRSAANEQVTAIECGGKDNSFLDVTCGGQNEWDCECREGFVQVPRQRWSRTVVESLTNQTVPLQAVSTNTTETIDRCFENNQEAERNVEKRNFFNYNGTLEAHTFDV